MPTNDRLCSPLSLPIGRILRGFLAPARGFDNISSRGDQKASEARRRNSGRIGIKFTPRALSRRCSCVLDFFQAPLPIAHQFSARATIMSSFLEAVPPRRLKSASTSSCSVWWLTSRASQAQAQSRRSRKRSDQCQQISRWPRGPRPATAQGPVHPV